MNPFANVPKKQFKRGDIVKHVGTGETGEVGWVDKSSGALQLREWARNTEDADGHTTNQRTRWDPPEYFELVTPPKAAK